MEAKRYNILSIVITTIIAIFATIKLYAILYTTCHWNNLSDFYSGLTIYSDHNKYLDLSVIFIYIGLFFILLPIVLFLGNKLKFYKFTDWAADKLNNIKPIKYTFSKDFYKLQYICLLGYLCLYPYNCKFYPVIISIIAILIIIGFIDIRKRVGGGKNFLSPWAIAPILLLICYNPYNQPIIPFDAHHLGEKFAVYYLHEAFKMDFYNDIMLVHGLKDILPSFTAKYLFGSIDVYSSALADIFLKNISTVVITILSGYIFSDSIIFAIPSVIIPANFYTKIYYCIYLIFLKHLSNNSYFKLILWIILYLVTSFILMMNWTTIGSFWCISSLPLAIYMLYKLFKTPNSNKFLSLFIIITAILIILLPNKDFIIAYLKQTQYYISGNLYAFGNDFGDYNYSLKQTLYYLPRFIVYIFLPIFIIELVYTLKNKRLNETFFYLFIILFSIISVNYAFGRIDYELLTRITYISLPFIGVFLPYYLYIKFPKLRENIIQPAIVIISIVLIFYNQQTNIQNFNKYDEMANKIGLNLSKNIINEIKNSTVFYDLTNHGLYYMYFNKKIPVQYTSFYNSISTSQAENSLRSLITSQPEIILLHSAISFDGIFPSLRINPIYRAILLSREYEVKSEPNSVYLKKANNKVNYTKNDLYLLDYTFSIDPLFLLAEVWGNSTKTLPMYEINEDYNLKKYSDRIEIEFKTSKNGKEFDLLYIEPVNKSGYNKLKNYSVEINNSNSILHIQSHRNGKLLIPTDDYPSWLLNENIKTITIYLDEELKSDYIIRFYKRKFSDDIKKYL